jgi:hypothetical protein
MHKNATKCNKTLSKWCKNKHGASKIIDTFETYQVFTQEIVRAHKTMSSIIPLSSTTNYVQTLGFHPASLDTEFLLFLLCEGNMPQRKIINGFFCIFHIVHNKFNTMQ